jgi:histidinol phosphatase-like enzyme
LPAPEEIRERSARDTRYLLPDAQFRYERTLEPPSLDEGFTSIETRSCVRDPGAGEIRALLFDLDDLLGRSAPALRADQMAIEPSRASLLRRSSDEGWLLFVHAWRPQIARLDLTLEEVNACFARLGEILGVEVESACCPHDAGPPICWCRKPIPGSALDFAVHQRVSLEQSVVVGGTASDRTMAERIGARFESSGSFFG